MSAEIIPFDFEEQAVRVVMIDSDPWFVLADVCRVLDIANRHDAASRLDDDERDTVGSTDSVGRSRDMTVVSESGLYALIFTSRKPEAKAFRKWVTGTVLPTLRRTGEFCIAPEAAPVMPMPPGSDMVQGIDGCTAADVHTWLDLIREGRRVGGRAAGLRLWAQSPLPPVSEAEQVASARDGQGCLAHLLAVTDGDGTLRDAICDRVNENLAPFALRVVAGDLFVGNGVNPGTRYLFDGTPWADGAHRAALLALPGVRPDACSRTLSMRAMRGVLVPLSLIEVAHA